MLPEVSGTRRTSQTTGDLTFILFVTQILTQYCITVTRLILTRMTSATITTEAESHIVKIVSELNDDLHNVWIEYYEDEDGDYCLDGELSDYI